MAPVTRRLLPLGFPRQSLTLWSLGLLAAGLLLGWFARGSGHPAVAAGGDVLKSIGNVWFSALQMAALPLVVTQMLAAVVGLRERQSALSLGVRAVCLIVVMLAGAAILTCVVAPPIVALYRTDPATIAALQSSAIIPDAARRVVAAGSAGQVAASLPRNVFDAAARGDILPVLLFVVVFGMAVNRLPDEQRAPLSRACQGLAGAMLQCVRWVLWLTPAGVFALGYGLALRTGLHVVGLMGGYVLTVCSVLLLLTLVLYPLTAALGRTTLATFARAVAPAQFVAICTQSSLASLPALVEGGRAHLALPPSSTGFVLPLSVSVFKVNRTVSSAVKLLFLAHVYGIALTVPTVASFLFTMGILSFGTAGVSGGDTGFTSLPAYLAAGLPIEGVVILEAANTIPDVFKTVFNVTGDMTLAALLSRSSRLPASAEAMESESAAAPEGVR